MKRPLIYSALLHVTVLTLLLIGFYNPFQRKISLERPVMMEFVQVAEQSAAPILAPEAIQDVEPKPEPPKPLPPEPKPEPPQPEPKPEPTPPPQPEPEPIKPEPTPQPEPKPEEAEPIPDPKAKQKPKEKPKEEKPKQQKAEITLDKKKKPTVKTDKPDKTKKKKTSTSKNFDDLLNELAKEENGNPAPGKGAPASKIGAVLTASEMDVLSRHMAQCWIIPAGLRDARNIRVPIKLNVGKDGTVQKAEIVEKARMSTDPSYRTAAESARRAVLDPRCSPLPIPQDKYEMFKEFIFNFDPKEMF